VELNSKGPIAEQEVKGHFMEKISAEVEPSREWQGTGRRAICKIHGSDSTAKVSTGWPLLRLTGGLRGCKEAVGHHQNRDQRQEENGVGGVGFAEPRRHFISRRFEDQPANHSNSPCRGNDGGGVVRDDVVDLAGSSGKARHDEILGDADDQHREGAHRQQNEAGKNKDMKVPAVL
jgi:hypothetical protein